MALSEANLAGSVAPPSVWSWRGSLSAFLTLISLLAAAVLACGAAGREAAPAGEMASSRDGLMLKRVFEEPMIPIGSEPGTAENLALAAALERYAKRSGPDDFTALTEFLQQHPSSAWNASLLTGLGAEYYNTAYYSRALEAWSKAWTLTRSATEPQSVAIGNRAVSELAYLYSRLGRMQELEALLKSVEDRVFIGAATERVGGAREGLWNMQHRPEISFRCGPLALQRIRRSLGIEGPEEAEIANSASTQRGMSLQQVAALSEKVRLGYQMAFREASGAFIVPSVVHWRVGHYAALVRQEGDRFLLEDPTFGNAVWASRAALEAETSGYFLIPPGPLPPAWRAVGSEEASNVWGKGITSSNDPGQTGPPDPKTGGGPCRGMAVPAVHLMLVNLNLSDEPVGYSPPVGPEVRLTVRYNHRDAFQPALFTYSNFGQKWTCDWIAFITENPQIPAADVRYYMMGGGSRTFTGFNTNTLTFAYQQYDQTKLRRVGESSYEMLFADGSKHVFGRSDGAVGTVRRVFLTQVVDPQGNTLTFGYDANLRLVSVTDAIGQVTTLAYGNPADPLQITRVTDPFGRFASFSYDPAGRLTNITDVAGMNSGFGYEATTDFIRSLVTPYGTHTFTRGQNGTTRWLETLYPDGSRDRVEFNQSSPGIAGSDPILTLPSGVSVYNLHLTARNTFYWSRNACATAYGDYTKARIYHWLHTENINTAAGILESSKEPLENRIWYNYAGQATPYFVGSNNRPTRVGRVLDDGSTQLYQFAYDGFGHVTRSVDPLGRTTSYVYSTNGIDLLEVRQSRGPIDDRLFGATYNNQHLPLTTTDAAGQTTTFTYNARGQLLTTTNPKGETTTYSYDENGYLIGLDGPLPGTDDALTLTYDAAGRVRTKTSEGSHTLTFDYDQLDHLIRTTYPDGTFEQFIYDRLEAVVVRDRAGRQTHLEFDAMRQLTRHTDPLGRETRYQWCACGSLSTLTDPLGRTTSWERDVQARLVTKRYADGSSVNLRYENATSRVRETVDEKGQVARLAYYRDNALKSLAYENSRVPTPAISYAYDPHYARLISMQDVLGTTVYTYHRVTASPSLGAGQLASEDGPLPNDTISYRYDELGRRVASSINGVTTAFHYDVAGRVISETNALGAFTNTYDGASSRLVRQTLPNSQFVERAYGGELQDHVLRRITHRIGTTPVSEFLYEWDNLASRIVVWSQQAAAQPAAVYHLSYDSADQLLEATATNATGLAAAYRYAYDPAGNRLSEQLNALTNVAFYNALNQISASSSSALSRTNEWDARERLTAVSTATTRTEFSYDARGRLAFLRHWTNGVQAASRRFLWYGNTLGEERDGSGSVVVKRFFSQGMKVETGPDSGSYFYTRDHLGSVREVTDGTGAVRARYSYDPYGRRTREAGDRHADFGFAGMFWCAEAGLALARHRAYDPELGRWLSRDPLPDAEQREGPNLYSYVGNDPVNRVDPLGLSAQKCCKAESELLDTARRHCLDAMQRARKDCTHAWEVAPETAGLFCADLFMGVSRACSYQPRLVYISGRNYLECLSKSKCGQNPCPKGGGGGPPPPPDDSHLWPKFRPPSENVEVTLATGREAGLRETALTAGTVSLKAGY
jgi:RHS repeat-associated protein